MPATPPNPYAVLPPDPEAEAEQERNQINLNIEAVKQFGGVEEGKRSGPQRLFEQAGDMFGRPTFAGVLLSLIALWIAYNFFAKRFGAWAFDPSPFVWLQGLIGLSSLLIGLIVLSKQNRLAKLAEQRAHLDMTLTLLTEQKAAKLIALLEELRRDMPNVRDRSDSHASELQKPMNPDLVLAVLEELAEPDAAD